MWGRLFPKADWPAGPPWGKVCPTIFIYEDAGAARKGAARKTVVLTSKTGI
ncbi:MAG: hypothetical protein Kow0063_22500 [Anaerolineae bacterium]